MKDGDLEEIFQRDQFGFVIVPENGAPCGDIIRPYSGRSRDPETEAVLTAVLHVSLFKSPEVEK